MPTESRVEFRSLDGLKLVGDVVVPDQEPRIGVLLAHGRGVTRHESGFFDRIAEGLAAAGIASLRFDLRGHGESEGTQEDVTLAGLLNDLRSGFEVLRAKTGVGTTSLVGQSFSGGVCAYYAAKRAAEVERLVMLCPRIDYKARTIDGRPYWIDDHLDQEHADLLSRDGFLQYSASFRHGRAFLNEVFWLRTETALGEVTAPTLLVHGDADTQVPIGPSRDAIKELNEQSRILEIPGAGHGFSVAGDKAYVQPQTLAWQAEVIDTITDWVSKKP
ncbi:alpha/beta hydrolase [Myceligenerans crystallogenes]|uniref:Alpha/beta fold hydrolase n=1 Tax=Myceligenerans crystallogenes TaxID=316335 RepID=A0ABN2ND35_9MICO